MMSYKYLRILTLAVIGLAAMASCGAMNSVSIPDPDVIVYHGADGDIDMISSYSQPLAHGQPVAPAADPAPGL